jgi:PmbA protein
MTDQLEMLNDLLAKAKRLGADAVDAVHIEAISLNVAQRLGKPEKLQRSEGSDVGLRVFIGKRQAIVSTSDFSKDTLNDMVERSIAMARLVPEDPFCGLAEPGELARHVPDVDTFDPSEPTPETLMQWTAVAEDAARAVEGVTNSEGAEASWSRATVTLAATNGLNQRYSRSSYYLGTSALAGSGTLMEQASDTTNAVYASDLRPAEDVGRTAGRKAVARLNPRKVATGQVPIVYDPQISRSLVSHFAGAVNGTVIARNTSFLIDAMNKPVFGDGITIVDDPHRPRGLRSKPFDGEGIANARHTVIDKGKLTTWFLDLRSARQLGLKTTGHASRSSGSAPSPSATNLYMEPGKLTPKQLMADIASGFYVTELIGFGVNGLTGDYSRGASGFWIDKGEIAYPVSEVTIAGNLKDMFMNVTPANDLIFRYGIDCPTLRVGGMTVAGR